MKDGVVNSKRISSVQYRANFLLELASVAGLKFSTFMYLTGGRPNRNITKVFFPFIFDNHDFPFILFGRQGEKRRKRFSSWR